jgi:hypothetical protein
MPESTVLDFARREMRTLPDRRTDGGVTDVADLTLPLALT